MLAHSGIVCGGGAKSPADGGLLTSVGMGVAEVEVLFHMCGQRINSRHGSRASAERDVADGSGQCQDRRKATGLSLLMGQ